LNNALLNALRGNAAPDKGAAFAVMGVLSRGVYKYGLA
jgi:hypothetical protein